MIRRIAAIALVLMFGGVATTASTQFPALGVNEPPAPLVREALASPYGRAPTAELGRALPAPTRRA